MEQSDWLYTAVHITIVGHHTGAALDQHRGRLSTSRRAWRMRLPLSVAFAAVALPLLGMPQGRALLRRALQFSLRAATRPPHRLAGHRPGLALPPAGV